MTTSGTAVERLRAVPRSRRRDALVVLVVAEFKAGLLMDEEDELPLDQSYLDLGLTSIGLVELRERLAGALGCDLDVTLMFNRPTVDGLLAYLVEEALSDLFGAEAKPAAQTGAVDERKSLVNDLLNRLYQGRTGP